jgi:hypothetical protein
MTDPGPSVPYTMADLIPRDLQYRVAGEAGIELEQAVKAVDAVRLWLTDIYGGPMALHPSNHAWATRYVNYLLTGGTPHSLDKKEPTP